MDMVSETRIIPAFPQGNLRQVFSDGSYSDFRTDNKVYNCLYTLYDTSVYSLSNNTLSLVSIQNGQMTDSTNATVLTLNPNILVLSFPNIYFVSDSNEVETIYTGVVIDSLRR